MIVVEYIDEGNKVKYESVTRIAFHGKFAMLYNGAIASRVPLELVIGVSNIVELFDRVQKEDTEEIPFDDTGEQTTMIDKYYCKCGQGDAFYVTYPVGSPMLNCAHCNAEIKHIDNYDIEELTQQGRL